MEKLQEYLDIAIDKIVFFAPKIVLAVIILWIGFKIIKKVSSLFDAALQRLQMSDSIRPFLTSIINVILKIALLFLIATIIGADLSGLVAILAAVSFAIGLSLQGSLGNFASGILILTLKPYKSGDWIEVSEKFGKVEEIGIFNTVLISPGSKTLIVPNSKITEDVVTNYSRKGVIRLEINVTMPYEEDFSRVKDSIENAIAPIDKILEDPTTEIGIESFDSHNVIIAVRPYVKPDDFWEVTFIVHREIKKAFSKNGIKVAYSEGVELGAIGS